MVDVVIIGATNLDLFQDRRDEYDASYRRERFSKCEYLYKDKPEQSSFISSFIYNIKPKIVEVFFCF